MSAALKDWITKRAFRDGDFQKPRLRISQAGSQCAREVYYRAMGEEKEPETLEGRLKMVAGTALDQYLLRDGGQEEVNAPECWFFQVPVEIQMGELKINGTADAVRRRMVPGQGLVNLHVADLKFVGANSWKKVQHTPKQEHTAQ